MTRYTLGSIGVIAALIGTIKAMQLNAAASPFEAFWCGTGQFAASDASAFAFGHCAWCALALGGVAFIAMSLVKRSEKHNQTSVIVAA